MHCIVDSCLRRNDGPFPLKHPDTATVWQINLFNPGRKCMPIKNKKSLTSKGVRMMLEAAIAKAQEFGIAVTVAIVDDGGHLLMLERMEGGRFHTVHSATTKATTAASNKRPTSSKGAQGQDLDVLHALGLTLAAGPQNWTAMEGGYPVIVENDCIGGIGVAGGDWRQDQEIAQAALRTVGASVNKG
jgi:glc operon protein GlcG